MEDTQKEFLADYERRLLEMLVGNLSSAGKLDGQLLTVEELNEKWHAAAPSYMADAVPQIARYPLAAVAWAMYVGMGAAVLWDKDWNRYSQTEDWYAMLSSPRGFDALDEYVTEVLLAMPLDSDRARTVEECVRSTAESALAMIRKERIEAQSAMAFHIFARTVKVMFEVGVAVELHRIGYKYVKVKTEIDPSQLS